MLRTLARVQSRQSHSMPRAPVANDQPGGSSSSAGAGVPHCEQARWATVRR
jgi:hypothetical protein